MNFGDLSDPDVLAAANLFKIQTEHEGLCYCEPYSVDWYADNFPGLPGVCFQLLADAGPVEKTVSVTASTTTTRRRRSRGGRRARMRRQRQFNMSLDVVSEMTNSDGHGSDEAW